ncbi:hypothetical protein PENSPDRAFT_492994 [Peniophora sp. CONT]|nr:hypothetical protein PENSPDRAFT_492994 [Peniophora sp. CONT]
MSLVFAKQTSWTSRLAKSRGRISTRAHSSPRHASRARRRRKTRRSANPSSRVPARPRLVHPRCAHKLRRRTRVRLHRHQPVMASLLSDLEAHGVDKQITQVFIERFVRDTQKAPPPQQPQAKKTPKPPLHPDVRNSLHLPHRAMRGLRVQSQVHRRDLLLYSTSACSSATLLGSTAAAQRAACACTRSDTPCQVSFPSSRQRRLLDSLVSPRPAPPFAAAPATAPCSSTVYIAHPCHRVV